jgi:hypothetical protein
MRRRDGARATHAPRHHDEQRGQDEETGKVQGRHEDAPRERPPRHRSCLLHPIDQNRWPTAQRHPDLLNRRIFASSPCHDASPAAPADDHGDGAHRALCGLSQQAQRRSTTRNVADQRRRSPLISATPRGHDLSLAWSPRRSCQSRTRPSPGEQISGMPASKTAAARLGGQGVASPRPPGGLPQGIPGAEPDDARAGSVEGCPRDALWSGCARSTGCRTSPRVQDRQCPSS